MARRKSVPKSDDSSNTVVVACKLPHGLQIHIDDTHVVLRGANDDAATFGGYGLTRVDGEFMEQWLALHANAPYVRNGLIFVEEDEDSAASRGEEQAEVQTGFEGVGANPDDKKALGIKDADEEDGE